MALDTLSGAGVEVIIVTHYPATTWDPKGEIR
jgi:hypothetical protein